MQYILLSIVSACSLISTVFAYKIVQSVLEQLNKYNDLPSVEYYDTDAVNNLVSEFKDVTEQSKHSKQHIDHIIDGFEDSVEIITDLEEKIISDSLKKG
jgi:hypothetical protein